MPLSMLPHGGALWPREKAGKEGRGYTFQWEFSFEKSCQRSTGRKCGSVDCCHHRRRDKRRVETFCLQLERISVRVKPDRHSGSLRRSLLQSVFSLRRQQTGSRLAGVHADGRSHQKAPTEASTIGTSKHVCGKLLCAGRVVSPSLGEYRTRDATGPLRWSGTHGRSYKSL